MKTYLKLIVLFCFLFITPIYAEAPYILQVNNIPYQLTTPLITKNDTVYMPLSELAKLSFTEVTTNQDTFEFNFNDKTYKFKPNQKTFNVASEAITLTTPILLVDETLYIPVEALEAMGYSSEINKDKQILNLTCPTIYSRNIDSSAKHTYINAQYNLENLPKHILSLSTEAAFEETLTNALTNKHYISFLDNSNSEKVVNYLSDRLAYPPYSNIFVSYRIINTHTYPNQIVDTTTLPLKIDFYGKTIRLNLGDERWTYPTIWSTFYPSQSLTEMDLQKSVDSTLMHALYEYYRNTFELKDDKYFEPFSLITSERTNEMVHDAYSLSYKGDDSLTEYETTYTIRVQRVHPSGSIHYIIDIEAK